MTKKKKIHTWTQIDNRNGKVEKYPMPFSELEIKEIAEKESAKNDKIYTEIPCPYKYNTYEGFTKTNKIINQDKYWFDVNVDLSLSAKPIYHIHYLIKMRETGEEVEDKHNGCGLFLHINNKSDVTLRNSEEIETTEIDFAESIKDDLFLPDDNAIDDYKKTYFKLKSYVSKNFANEVNRVLERLVSEFYTLYEHNELREEYIRKYLDNEEKELRKRIPAPKGRVAIKNRSDLRVLQYEFMLECYEVFEELESKKMPLNKSQLAKKMFRGDNPLLLLNRKLKDFELTFEHILKAYTEQKSP